MGTSKDARLRLHEAMHRLPGMPAHDRAPALNSNATAQRRHGRSLPNRPLTSTPLRNPGAHHGRPPRVLVSWQTWIARRLGHQSR